MSAAAAFRTLSIVVPVYQSEASLPALVDRIEAFARASGARVELLLVNDGSRDRSWEVIGELARERPWIRGIDLMRNYGQHAALLCGIRAATGEIVVTMDDDLQHPPEEIPRLLEALGDDVDVVYGKPREAAHDAWRNLSSTIVKLALRSVVGAETAAEVSAFRAFRTPLRNAFASYRSPAPSLDVLLTWGTSRFASVRVRHEPRRTGRSNYTLWRLAGLAIAMTTGFSTAPLRIASLVGFGFTLFGFGVLAWVLGRYLLLGYSMPGFPFLASIIAIFSGAQLFALGIIGEYLARMHLRMLDWPTYVVRTETEDERAGRITAAGS
jgi:glycosyltransferase involved in cell wall biosynthesis